MGRLEEINFELTKMKADGRLLGLSRLCQISFDAGSYYSCSALGEIARLFPELNDKVDPYRLVFVGNYFTVAVIIIISRVTFNCKIIPWTSMMILSLLRCTF